MNLIFNEIKVLIIDDNDVDRIIYKRMLTRSEEFPCTLFEANSAHDAIEILNKNPIDCILLDYLLPDMDGLELLDKIRKQFDELIPIIMLTGHGSEGIAVKAMKQGAADYLIKNKFTQESLIKVIIHTIKNFQLKNIIKMQKEKLEYYSYYDSLTGLMNRHTFTEIAKQLFNNASRHHDMLSIIFIDLDNFMTLNDTLGHLAGDEIIIEVAMRLKESAPNDAIIVRWGDDEFAVLLAGKELQQGTHTLSQKIIKNIKLPIHLSIDVATIGASLGIAYFPTNSHNLDALIKNAYTALMHAKKAGRGIIMEYTQDMG